MDNLGIHKGAVVREAIEAAGAQRRFLPPCSPDLNPSGNAFSKLKALLRKAASRTPEALWHAVGAALNAFTIDEYQNYFKASEYQPG